MSSHALQSEARVAARNEERLTRAAVVLTLVLGGLLVALIYLPLVLLVALSVSSDPLSGLPGGFTLNWFAELFAKPDWLDPLVATLQIAVLVALLCVVFATLVGRAIPRLRRGQRLIMMALLVPLVVPGIVLGIQEFAFWRTLIGIKPGMWSIVMTHFIWAFPFALLGMLVVTLRFDNRLIEAAADLGANRWQQFWDIERPLLMPGITTAGLFGFMISLTELSRTLFVRGGVMTLPTHIWAEASARASQVPLIYGLNALIAVVSVALSVLAVLILGRSGHTR